MKKIELSLSPKYVTNWWLIEECKEQGIDVRSPEEIKKEELLF